MSVMKLHRTVGVMVGRVQVGGGAPIVVQSMTMTDTADARATAQQCIELAAAGSDMVRVTVNTPDDVWVDIAAGRLDGTQAIADGRYTVEGDYLVLAKLQTWFPMKAP